MRHRRLSSGLTGHWEALWLLTIVLVPLAFLGRSYGEWSSEIGSFELPKITILRTTAGLIASLWLIKRALNSQSIPGSFSRAFAMFLRPASWPSALRDWLLERPVRWLMLAVLLFLGSTLLSTILSASSSVSLWGDVPGQDSYSTYTVIAYLVVFAVIGTHLKTAAQLWRLLGAIVVMGVLTAGYGISQHYGHDFLDLIQPPNAQRVSSTMGNSTFFGAVLLMSIPVSVVLAAINLRGPLISRRSWWTLWLWAAVIAVQLLGLAFTLTRGSWFGAALALVALIVLTAVFVGWREMVRAVLALGLALAVTVAVLMTPTGSSMSSTAEAQSASGTAASVAAGRIKEAGQHTFGGGVGGRVEIWKGSWRLIANRPWFGFDSLSLSSLRPVIGYGPDFFRQTYLLESPSGFDHLPSEPAHAHNYFVHQWVELGILGLLTSLGVFLTFFLVGGYQLLVGRSRYSATHKLLLAALLATVAGRLLEQIIGVARVSDLTLFWVLLGAFVALPMVMGERDISEHGPYSPGRGQPRGTRFHPGAVLEKWPLLVRLGAVVLVVGIGYLTWTKSINYFRAGIIADQGAQQFRDGRMLQSLASLDRAIDLAPDVSSYYTSRTTVYRACLRDSQTELVSAAVLSTDQRDYDLCEPDRQHDRNQQWVEKRPFNFRARLGLADSTLHLGQLREDAALMKASARLYQEVAEMAPNSWPLWNRLAEVQIQVGQPRLALPPLTKSLSITGDTASSLAALFLQSRAYHSLGLFEEAIESADKAVLYHPESGEAYYLRGASNYASNKFAEALEDLDQATLLNPGNALAYNIRGLTHARMGRLDLAVEDFNKTLDLNPGLAAAYNNRGFVYRNLGKLERSIDDLNQAIELDPTLAIAFYNRTLAHLLLGEDAKAQQDADSAVSLGFDSVALKEAMAEVKRRKPSD